MNVSTFDNAKTAFQNSGWFDRFQDDESERATRFLRQHSSSGQIGVEEFDTLMSRFAVDVVRWAPGDL